MLTVPCDPTTRGASRRLKSTCPGLNLNYLLFSKYSIIPAHHFRAWRHSHPQFHFLSGVFIMTSVTVTSSPRARENLRSMCVPTRALSRNVLSLTKPPDKIWPTKNDNIRKSFCNNITKPAIHRLRNWPCIASCLRYKSRVHSYIYIYIYIYIYNIHSCQKGLDRINSSLGHCS